MPIFDFAVIGSGPSGNIAARLLGKRKKLIWLEEAKRDSPYPAFSFEEIQNNYRYGGQNILLSKPLIPFAQPLAFGGGLAINAGLFQRPEKAVFESWQLDTKLWGWQDFDLECREIEKLLKIQDPLNEQDSVSTVMLKGATKLGWKSKMISRLAHEDRRSFQLENKKFVLEGGGAFEAGSRAQVIEFHRKARVWKIQYFKNGISHEVHAKIILLACGPIQTPSLLMRSGLLPKLHSKFAYHPVAKVIAEYPGQIHDGSFNYSPLQIKEFSPQISIGSSVTTKHLLWTEHLKNGIRDPEVLRKYKNQLMFYCSTGKSPRTHLLYAGKNSDPLAFSFHRQISLDFEKGLKHLIDFSFATGATALYMNGRKLTSEPKSEDKISFLKTPLTAIHLFSSLPMSDHGSEVDGYGQVRGQDHLYCIDASILPGSPGVNPQETIMAFASRITKRLL